ncbi:M91 family zinc metallopeptidase [Pseudomonas sp. S09G 359]|jgi:hypothetical protein|uniref:M91 family zinc metallopeptidase n=1 Tax=Pseudomonas sp. S09G 359 TaxID=2054919 RepID=UPI000C6DDFAB|nr:M91 family zinc metallopeptidase [Pseudomonas sp. S09G 359]AUG05645.1 hemolysin [Pseudomonas sp. S09G 359]
MNILAMPSIYPVFTPPSAADVPDGAQHRSTLVDDGTTKIQHLSTYVTDQQGKRSLDVSRVLITTTDKADNVKISVGANHQLNARINGKDYKLPLTANNDSHALTIKTEGGNDRISVDKHVNIETHIHSGDGDDYIAANGRSGSVNAGKGNDYLRLGTGHMVAFGGDGDDVMIAGSGNAVLSGGKGNDKLYADYFSQKTNLRQVYLNGDQGNDELYGGSGKTVLSGGLGNDKLVGYRQTTIYTGAGADTVYSYDTKDQIYAKKTDSVHSLAQVKPKHVEYTDAGKTGFTIKGPEPFVEQVENYLEHLRGSPAGQRMLQEMDRLAEKNRNSVTIIPAAFIGRNSYRFGNEFRNNISDDDYDQYKDRPELGYIKDGAPGSVATHAEIEFHPDYFEKLFSISPLLALYHEMSHAYNGATGTNIPGEGPVFSTAEGPTTVENNEYQAVGLTTGGQPFDFDNDPLTPPTDTNPSPFNENALRKEMGVPLRDRYHLDEPSRLV